MGQLCGKTSDTTSNNNIVVSRQHQEKEIKVLLLGAGESGKSTIFKQMRIIHDRGYTNEELKDFRFIVFTNIIRSIKNLIEATQTLGIEIEEEENKVRATKIADLDDDFVMYVSKIWDYNMGSDIEHLWQDPGIKKAYERRNEFQLDDSTGFYMSEIKRICQPDYLPSEEDVLWARVKTTGIIEVKCTIGGKCIKLVDVGGQRNERKKVSANSECR